MYGLVLDPLATSYTEKPNRGNKTFNILKTKTIAITSTATVIFILLFLVVKLELFVKAYFDVHSFRLEWVCLLSDPHSRADAG